MNSTHFNLDQVAQEFDNWRASRRDRNSPIPEKLWSMVAVIYPHYSRGNICQRLGLSSEQLKRRGYTVEHSAAASAQTTAQHEKPSFVHVAPSPRTQTAQTPDDSAVLEVIRPDGTTIRLLHLQPALLSTLFQHIIGG